MFPALKASQRSLEVEVSLLAASSVGSGHPNILAGRPGSAGIPNPGERRMSATCGDHPKRHDAEQETRGKCSPTSITQA
ncbi:MAG TPA: hypothetical protein VES01_01115, partial [Dermatophilaceae bacterium]|nr:hypothetical protein [Dermatophilaceae bacterium]